jgi:hypothetical protein
MAFDEARIALNMARGREQGPVVLFGVAKPPRPKNNGPKILASGEVRRRIPCTAADLHAIDEEVSQDVIDLALQAVNSVNLDDHHFDDVVRFGADLQLEHGRLTEAEFDLAKSEDLKLARQHYAELLSLLERLDPNLVFAARSGAAALLKRAFGHRYSETEFSEDYLKIESLVHDLHQSAGQLQDVKHQMKRHLSRYQKLEINFAAHILAARFIISHIANVMQSDVLKQKHYDSQSQALENRLASLEASKAMMAVSRQTLKVLTESIKSLGISGSNLIGEELPAWQAAYSAALIKRRTAAFDGDTLSSLQNIHQTIINKLKRKDEP